ncbi:single-strand selective monofunctional uracil DNA glycosylase-like [Branchiostoma floridae]|uniref:Single-strand selective monofunctional uracil DNA glycosylase-like n=2 Tax=Branchiostoma floridae TaxID=7739 RepID=A0A9J7HHF9_BRAFL|nr:single-strand selective monofunctional uracil DNA glycosylase-like [Branchiostoma floridae]
MSGQDGFPSKRPRLEGDQALITNNNSEPDNPSTGGVVVAGCSTSLEVCEQSHSVPRNCAAETESPIGQPVPTLSNQGHAAESSPKQESGQRIVLVMSEEDHQKISVENTNYASPSSSRDHTEETNESTLTQTSTANEMTDSNKAANQKSEQSANEIAEPPVADAVTVDRSIAMKFLQIEANLCETLRHLVFRDPVTHLYNPLDYARETHKDYVMKYCCSHKDVLFLGMNPGPFGMAQNGVPFGDTTFVKDFLKISGNVNPPALQHPKRLITGLACTHSEVSGTRFWGLFRTLCKTPENFFRRCFVHNYCPLVFMTKTGKNVTPPSLHMTQREPLLSACDTALVEVIRLLQVKMIVGVGRFAQERAQYALKMTGLNIPVLFIMHPSPINPQANKGWAEQMMVEFEKLGIMRYLVPKSKG